MKLNLKDEPREWRKSALLLLLALAIFSSLLRWRQHLDQRTWFIILLVLAATAMVSVLRPRWFRGYHLFSMRLGFAISRLLGRWFLTLFFSLILTPVGWMLRLAGKDLLQLRRTSSDKSYWQPARIPGPLDRLF